MWSSASTCDGGSDPSPEDTAVVDPRQDVAVEEPGRAAGLDRIEEGHRRRRRTVAVDFDEHQLARVGFGALGLQTYLTAGPKESRAWTIGKGWTAPQAAGVIHTDFQKGFIKAEIISFADLVEAGTIAEARSRGKARIEGKDYVMQDGDVVEFRHS